MIFPSEQFFVKILKIHIFSRLEFDLIEIILTKDYPKSNSTQLPVSSSQFQWNNLYCLTGKHFLSADCSKMSGDPISPHNRHLNQWLAGRKVHHGTVLVLADFTMVIQGFAGWSWDDLLPQVSLERPRTRSSIFLFLAKTSKGLNQGLKSLPIKLNVWVKYQANDHE